MYECVQSIINHKLEHTYCGCSFDSWSITCLKEEETLLYRSPSWPLATWNSTVQEQRFHCPRNTYISGVIIEGQELLSVLCVYFNKLIEITNSRVTYLFQFSSSQVVLEKNEVISKISLQYSSR